MFRLPLVYPMFWDRPLLHRKNSLRAKVVQLKNDYIKQTIASSNLKFSQNVDNSPYIQKMKKKNRKLGIDHSNFKPSN